MAGSSRVCGRNQRATVGTAVATPSDPRAGRRSACLSPDVRKTAVRHWELRLTRSFGTLRGGLRLPTSLSLMTSSSSPERRRPIPRSSEVARSTHAGGWREAAAFVEDGAIGSWPRAAGHRAQARRVLDPCGGSHLASYFRGVFGDLVVDAGDQVLALEHLDPCEERRGARRSRRRAGRAPCRPARCRSTSAPTAVTIPVAAARASCRGGEDQAGARLGLVVDRLDRRCTRRAARARRRCCVVVTPACRLETLRPTSRPASMIRWRNCRVRASRGAREDLLRRALLEDHARRRGSRRGRRCRARSPSRASR